MSHANVYENAQKQKQDELALQYLPAAKAAAYRLKERLPSSVDYSDLVSVATEELIKLARKYDANLNDNFWGYAKLRVQGAMLDYLRNLDTVSRANRKLIKQINKVIENWYLQFDCEPTNEQIAEELEEEVKKIAEAKMASEIYAVLPINEQMSIFDESNALESLSQEEKLEKIQVSLEKLSEREQLIVQLYYLEELSLKEISSILGITESRISQIHKRVVKKVKDNILGDYE